MATAVQQPAVTAASNTRSPFSGSLDITAPAPAVAGRAEGAGPSAPSSLDTPMPERPPVAAPAPTVAPPAPALSGSGPVAR